MGEPLTKPKVEGYKRRYWDPRNKRPSETIPKKVTFSGLTEDLKSHIYNMGTRSQTNQFKATTKDLASYAGRKGTNPQDIRISVKSQKDVITLIPYTSNDIDGDMANILLVKEIDSYNKRTQQCHQKKAKIYSVVLGQFTEAMKNCLEGEEPYKNIDEESDVICLLLLIKTIAYSCDSKYYPVLETHMEPRGFYSTYQSKSSSCDEYLEMMTYLRDVISHCGRFIGNRPFLVDKFLKAAKPVEPDDPTDDEKSAENNSTEKAYMATAFLSGIN